MSLVFFRFKFAHNLLMSSMERPVISAIISKGNPLAFMVRAFLRLAFRSPSFSPISMPAFMPTFMPMACPFGKPSRRVLLRCIFAVLTTSQNFS